MRLGRSGHCGRRWRGCGFLVTLGIALTAGAGSAQPIEYVITFDKVVVRHPDEIFEIPEVAHLEPPTEETPSPPVGGERSEGGLLAERSRRPPESRQVDEIGRADRARGSERSAAQSPEVSIKPYPVSPLAFAPGPGSANPSFVQHGFLVEAFWAVKMGTPEAYFKRAHFHPPDLSSGFEAQHLGNPNELHGIYIRSLDGKPFGLKSLRYRVTRNRQLPRKSLSIEGFSNFNVSVLVATSFDPRWSTRGQFVAFPVGLPVGNDPTLPWWNLPIFGFEVVDQVYIASSASVDLDDIVLIRNEPPPIPSDQPATGEGDPVSDQ